MDKNNGQYTYQVSFPFRGKYYFIDLTANQIANQVVEQGDDVSEFIYENKNNYLDEIITDDKGNKYSVTFSIRDPKNFNVYEYEDDGGGTLVEENIPWIILKIISNDGEILYNLTDNI